MSFSVGLMSSWATRSPTYVSKLGLRVLAYLANTKEKRLNLVPVEDAGLEVYTDASFAPYSERSISGIVVQLAGRCVFWKSRRQNLVSLSTAECELIAACEGWLLAQSMQALATELSVHSDITLRVDNVAALILAEGGGSQRTRHLRVRAHFLKEMIDNCQLSVAHCPGEVQIADLLTKALPAPRLEALNGLLGVIPPASLDSAIQSVTVASRAFRSVDPSEGQGMILVMALLMLQLQPASSQSEEEQDPVDLDLYLVAVMMACSVLFVWEVGKHCFRQCRRENDVRVASVQPSEESERRSRRREAVRRAIEREAIEGAVTDTGGARESAASPTVSASNPQASSHVHVHMPPPTTFQQVSQETTAQPPPSRSTWTLTRPPTPPIPDPPPPPPETRGSTEGLRRSRNSREIGVQTEGPQGLSNMQLCEIELITSSARTPGVLHIFPDCHALRMVQSTHRRTFCRYCLMNLRQRGYNG